MQYLKYGSHFKQNYTYKEEDYAPENYLLEKYSENMEYKEKLKKKSANDTVQGSAYMIGKPENDETITKMIFDGTIEEDNYVKSYWLATPRVFFEYDVAYVGPGAVYGGGAGNVIGALFYSYGYKVALEHAVRPVVSLKPEVTVEDIKVISGTEEEWTGNGVSRSPLESGYVEEGQIGVDGN